MTRASPSKRSCTRPSTGEIDRWFASLPSDAPFGVADIPLLYETGHEADFDAVIVAACPPEEQLRRAMARDQLSRAEAAARLAAQWPIDEKVTSRRSRHLDDGEL